MNIYNVLCNEEQLAFFIHDIYVYIRVQPQ